jgi:nucleotide-binding universal stress UspA family protein
MTAEHAPTAHAEVRAGRIVAGIDGSEASMDALEWAARQANASGSTLEVIMTWEWPQSYGWGIAYPTGYDPAEAVDKVLAQARSALHQEYPDLKISVQTVQGHAAPILVDASKGADLLVVGSRGHGEFVGMLIGSVGEYCATHAHCPVLVHRAAA